MSISTIRVRVAWRVRAPEQNATPWLSRKRQAVHRLATQHSAAQHRAFQTHHPDLASRRDRLRPLHNHSCPLAALQRLLARCQPLLKRCAALRAVLAVPLQCGWRPALLHPAVDGGGRGHQGVAGRHPRESLDWVVQLSGLKLDASGASKEPLRQAEAGKGTRLVGPLSGGTQPGAREQQVGVLLAPQANEGKVCLPARGEGTPGPPQ